MAEVAASAAGLISLGLQVCTGLVKYFNAYKDYRKDTEAVVRRTRSLSNLLEYLASVLQSPGFDGSYAAQMVEDEVLACSEGMYELERMHKRCVGQSDTQTSGAVAKQWQRAVFPLRKGDLESLGRTLSNLQSNLKTAMQILSM